ncbi:MAG: hypothetical protein KOO62_00440 [candidate division Zixibacteria bacterium]|nr:hypothetical protein [candidate division Zixibacteria bacterium]
MNGKNILTIILLLFVAASVAWLVSGKGSIEQTTPLEELATTSAEDGFVAYYLHGMRRCATCEKLESYSIKAVQSGFAKELESGQLQWRVLNYDLPENEHFLSNYDITHQSVVITLVETDSVIRWRNLDKIWDLVGDEEAFMAYVQTEISDFIGER